MKARLIILVVVAGALAVYFAVPKKAAAPEDDTPVMSDDELERIAKIRELQTPLGQRPLPGEEPPEPPELSVQVEVDRSAGKNRLYFTISEAHGYYVESFTLEAWYKGSEGYEPDDSPLSMEFVKDVYLKANETLRECAEVVPAELANIGDDIGATEDWDVRLLRHGRARAENPDPLPRLPDVLGCGS